jgi:hypothetical protein
MVVISQLFECGFCHVGKGRVCKATLSFDGIGVFDIATDRLLEVKPYSIKKCPDRMKVLKNVNKVIAKLLGGKK